jgi:hypothetical protein
MTRPIARVPGEQFDADQVTLPCEVCNLNEYGCMCEQLVCAKCKRTFDDYGYCHCKSPNTPSMERVEAAFAKLFPTSLVEVEDLGPGRIAA